MPQVYYSVLMERTIPDYAFAGFMDMAMRAGWKGFARINIGYSRVDVARNTVVKAFLGQTTDPDDTLIMLDCDHVHPDDVLERLAAHNEDVVVALAFRRCEPYDPQIYRFGPDNRLIQPSEWGKGLLPIDAFGCAAVAMKRRVFTKLEAQGIAYPWFRFWYPKGMGMDNNFPSEDIFFGLACKSAGIGCYCDTTIVCPHLTAGTVDDGTWAAYLKDNPQLRIPERDIPEDLRSKLGVGA